MVIRKIPVYTLDTDSARPLSADTLENKSFVIALPPLKKYVGKEQTIIDAPGVLSARIICRSLDTLNMTPEMISLHKENCFDLNEENEWILDISFTTVTKEGVSESFPLRLPLSLDGILDRSLGIWFDGTWMRIMLDSEVLNENSGIGDLPSVTSLECADGITICSVISSNVSYRTEESDVPADFYDPHGFNTHVGDVMTFFHDGVYHVMYLIDRRHHASRNGRGAHYIAHLTTRDLITWEEQPPVAEIENPYETFGTGTMFFHKGKYYMSYGLHTSRHPSGKFCEPTYDTDSKSFGYKTFDEAYSEGGMPMGATLSVSDDGINFKRTELLYHGAQNPSVYSTKEGGLILYGGYGGEGIYDTDDILNPFVKTESKLIFCGPNTALDCSSECPAFFEMNGYKYLIVGFRGYFRTLSTDSETMVDAIKLGETVYDGLSVPMVAEFDNGRRIIAGWIRHELGWGAVLMQRELFQEENGKLGMKWIPELYPEKIGDNIFREGDLRVDEKCNYILEGRAKADENGVFALSFGKGDKYSQLKIDLNAKKAQFVDIADGKMVADTIKTPYEKRLEIGHHDYHYLKYSNNFAIPDVDVDNEFGLRVIIRYSKKMRTTVCDVEIDGKRTMILMTPNLFVDTVNTAAGSISDGSLYRIKN